MNSISACNRHSEPPWTHLELGAGNYGNDGYTQAALKKTVAEKISAFCQSRNYLYLPPSGTGNYNPKTQYRVLFATLDELVSRYGPKGIFHVNDIYEDYATLAAEKLREYALSRRYFHVIIEAIPGDYELIDAAQTLSKYHMTTYSSVHLKNPETHLYHDKMDGDFVSCSEKSLQRARSILQRLANASKDGLYLFIPNTRFVRLEEQKCIKTKEFYYSAKLWKPLPYIDPAGRILRGQPKVFFIPRQTA